MSSGGRLARLAAIGAAGAVLAGAVLRRGRPYDLQGRVVLVSGGSRGLGFALARALGREGARVAICGRDADTLERARRELAAAGADVVALRADVSDPAQVERLVRDVGERLGPVDVLVNNAGTMTVGPIETMTLEDFQEAMQTNFWAAVHATLAVLPGMRARGRGRIVNITSIGGKVSVPHLLPYNASKFALVGLSEGLRAELGRHGIRVTTVVPGLMRTGSPRHASFKGQHRAEYAWFSIADSLPLVSMAAERAARQVVAALRRGDAEVVLSAPARVARVVHGVWPGVVADALGVVNRLLPSGQAVAKRPGWASGSPASPSWVTRLGDRAGRRLNQGGTPPAEPDGPPRPAPRAASRAAPATAERQRVRDVMTPHPTTTPADTSLTEAARAMRDAGIGDVIVVEGGEVRGLLTDRDIVVRAVAEGRDPGRTRVAEICSRELAAVSPDDDVEAAIRLMRARAVRRLPVVEGSRAVGVLSLGDLATARDPGSVLGQISAAPPNT
jgi:NAD(P)-dependent dehydrogenase (short-subunit alcohol dehydrogenase family)/predicted transcriptional regulator